MKISAKIHGIIDYIFVAFLWLAPTLFSLPESTATFTYILGFIHLLLTLCTTFEVGVFPLISLKAHGWIELVVAMALVPIALLLGDADGEPARNFCLSIAAAIFIFWLISDYKFINPTH